MNKDINKYPLPIRKQNINNMASQEALAALTVALEAVTGRQREQDKEDKKQYEDRRRRKNEHKMSKYKETKRKEEERDSEGRYRNDRDSSTDWKWNSNINRRDKSPWRYGRNNGDKEYRDRNREERKSTDKGNGDRHKDEEVNNGHITEYDVYKEGEENLDPYRSIIDTGCPKTVTGQTWMDVYMSEGPILKLSFSFLVFIFTFSPLDSAYASIHACPVTVLGHAASIILL